MPRPIELRGKNALIVGCGGIGLNVAERISSFGVKVNTLDDNVIPMLSFISAQYLFDQIDKVIKDMDIVICCAPLTNKTFKIFNKKLIQSFKPGSFFINISRGGLVELDALTFGIENKILAGVGIDVSDPEPMPYNHPFEFF